MTCGHTTLIGLLTVWQSEAGSLVVALWLLRRLIRCCGVPMSPTVHALCVQGWPSTPALNLPAHNLSLPDQPAPPRLSVRLLASACSSSHSGTSISRCGHLGPNRLLPCEDAHCADAFLACYPPRTIVVHAAAASTPQQVASRLRRRAGTGIALERSRTIGEMLMQITVVRPCGFSPCHELHASTSRDLACVLLPRD
ncbi:hypothetical protein BKA63DRAFT_64230 [Paraphoma chrysanthemicola]|nr:hypothetical protein BKA63DRAFT_64230 [Paraphoma chrysanthemicola]